MPKLKLLMTTAAAVMVAACAPARNDYAAELKPALDAFIETSTS